MMENYADPVDRAVVEQERLLEEHLRQALKQPVEKLADLGICHNCHEGTTAGQRFCDADCRDDYEKRSRSRKQRVY